MYLYFVISCKRNRYSLKSVSFFAIILLNKDLQHDQHHDVAVPLFRSDWFPWADLSVCIIA